jgi:hypothetical protein
LQYNNFENFFGIVVDHTRGNNFFFKSLKMIVLKNNIFGYQFSNNKRNELKIKDNPAFGTVSIDQF